MSDLKDEPDHTGNSTSRNTNGRASLSNEVATPGSERKSSHASPEDQPKKKRKVNHGSHMLSNLSAALLTPCLQRASTVVAR